MRRVLQGLTMVVLALVGLGLGFYAATVEAPIHFEFLHVDYADPDQPGHLKGMLVSLPELLLHTSIAVGSLAVAFWLWRCLKKSDPPHLRSRLCRELASLRWLC